jgi:hypothetical protein
VERFMDGVTMLEPGLVQYPLWRPDPGGPPAKPVPAWCAVGRKE